MHDVYDKTGDLYALKLASEGRANIQRMMRQAKELHHLYGGHDFELTK